MINWILRCWMSKFSKNKEYYKIVKHLFGICPNNIELYKLALIHRSASLFLDDGTPINNERLEFLGDSVIQTIVSDYLFIEFPEENEGFLTQLRSKIVSRSSLNHLAYVIGLEEHVIAQRSGNFSQKHLYGDALEAMMGAIYLDKGYNFANRILINRILSNYINLNDMTETETDFKSRLIEWSQKNKREISFHTIHSTQYTLRKPHFQTTITLDRMVVGQGEGTSKKEAEQVAARSAHDWLKENGSTSEPLSDEHPAA